MFLRIAVFALVLTAPITAVAQTIQLVQETSLPRLDRGGAQVQKRPLTLQPEGINRQDCLEEQQIEFPLQLAGFQANAALDAWASLSGADCSPQTNRVGPTAICWKVVEGIPLQATPRVPIPVRRILAGASSSPTPDAVDPNLCGSVDLTTFTVQFLLFGPGDRATPVATKSVQIVADTFGSPPPADVATLPGDGKVAVRWGSAAGAGALGNVSGWNVYCASNAATVGTCASILPVGSTPDADVDARFRCGSLAGAAGTSALVTATADQRPLANGAGYAFAVATVDAFGNIGALSSMACETPYAGAPEVDGEGGEGSSCAVAASSPMLGRAGAGLSATAIAIAAMVGVRILRRWGRRSMRA